MECSDFHWDAQMRTPLMMSREYPVCDQSRFTPQTRNAAPALVASLGVHFPEQGVLPDWQNGENCNSSSSLRHVNCVVQERKWGVENHTELTSSQVLLTASIQTTSNSPVSHSGLGSATWDHETSPAPFFPFPAAANYCNAITRMAHRCGPPIFM